MLGLSACGGSPALARWMPKPTTKPWQWQLQGRIDTSVPARVYEVDGFDVGSATVSRLHSMGRRVICYLDVGSWESYRPDRGAFPRSVIGKRYEGFPDERWMDIRRIDLLAGPLKARFETCRRKGFDAVEPDNINGFTNDTGFPLTAADQLRFNRWVARQVHRRGMSVALKNDPEQAARLAGTFDFAVVEQCFQYHECGSFSPFVDRGKAIFEAEYEIGPDSFCAKARALDFSAIRKSYDLFAKPWQTCG
ncbi:MAG: endo alpha-1,4 polygalactosaminidase [Solirubrobacterales bacterium]